MKTLLVKPAKESQSHFKAICNPEYGKKHFSDDQTGACFRKTVHITLATLLCFPLIQQITYLVLRALAAIMAPSADLLQKTALLEKKCEDLQRKLSDATGRRGGRENPRPCVTIANPVISNPLSAENERLKEQISTIETAYTRNEELRADLETKLQEGVAAVQNLKQQIDDLNVALKAKHDATDQAARAHSQQTQHLVQEIDDLNVALKVKQDATDQAAGAHTEQAQHLKQQIAQLTQL